MGKIVDRLRRQVRDDAKDGWVDSAHGELPLLFALPVLFLAGIFCIGGGVAALLAVAWGKGAVLLAAGLCFFWLGFHWAGGWRERRVKRRGGARQ